MIKKFLKPALILIFTAYYLLFPPSCNKPPVKFAIEEIISETTSLKITEKNITEEITLEEEYMIEDREVPLAGVFFPENSGEGIETPATDQTNTENTTAREPAPRETAPTNPVSTEPTRPDPATSATAATTRERPPPTAAVTLIESTEPTLSDPGTTSPTPTQPTIQPPTEPPTRAPTQPPTLHTTQPPTEPPTGAPTQPPTQSPTQPPTQPPTEPPTLPPTEPPTQPPTEPKRLSSNISLSNIDKFTNTYKNYNPVTVTITSGDYGMKCNIPVLTQSQKNDSATLKSILRDMYENSGLVDRFSDGFELYSIDVYGAVVPGKTYYDSKTLFDDVLADCEVIVANNISGVSGAAFSYFAGERSEDANNVGKYIILLSQDNATYIKYADRSGDAYAIAAMLFSFGHEGSHTFFDCQTEVWAQFAAFKTTGDLFSGSGAIYNLSIVCDWLSDTLGTSKAYYTAITGKARFQSDPDFGEFVKYFGPGREIPHISYSEFSAMVDYIKFLIDSGISITSEEMTIANNACKDVMKNNASAPESRAFLIAHGVKLSE